MVPQIRWAQFETAQRRTVHESAERHYCRGAWRKNRYRIIPGSFTYLLHVPANSRPGMVNGGMGIKGASSVPRRRLRPKAMWVWATRRVGRACSRSKDLRHPCPAGADQGNSV